MSIHYGKIGTAGQKLDKEFESAEETVKEAEKAISKKLKEGYMEGNLTSWISPQLVIQVNEIAKSPKNVSVWDLVKNDKFDLAKIRIEDGKDINAMGGT